MEPQNQVTLTSISVEDQLKVAAQLLGFKTMPVDITTFMEDPYYLGNICQNLYPFWKTKARELYPTPIHNRYPILVFKGAIGTGKSTFVRVLALYQIHKLMCLKNIHQSLGLMPGKYIKFSFFSYTSGLAQTDFLDVIRNWYDESPYFSELLESGRLGEIDMVADGTRGNKNIGSDVLFYNLSELNFVNYDKAWEKLDQALKRFDSRFGRMTDYFGHIIVDTSSRGDDSIADNFVNNNPYGDKVYVVNTNQWIVREHLNYYGKKGWFRVYCGDATHQPFIESPIRPITMDLDPDRIISVPEELRPDFEFDLITALQDKAGVSTSASDKFFPDVTNLLKCFKLPMRSPDVIKLDFFDKGDKLVYHLDSYIRDIPDDRILYIHYDIGVTGDNTGLGLAYFDHWNYFDKADGSKFRMPYIKVPIGIGLNRFEGQETPIYQLEEFIYDLNRNYEIGMFSADQYASRQLLQDLTLNKIPNRYLSVDRTDEAYVTFKSLANLQLLELPQNELYKGEVTELRRIGNKVDHLPTLSKDISDGVTGAIHSCYLDLDHASQLSSKYKAETHGKVILERSNSDIDKIQSMLQGIY